MKIGFVVNDVDTEIPEYTTTRLALRALQMGHEVWEIGVGDFAYDPDGTISGRGRSVPKKRYASVQAYLETLQGEKAVRERVGLEDMDVVLLRNDPAEDAVERPWAQHAGIVFGKRAMHHGTLVLNDPDGLAKALNKMYFQDFPEEVRPRTLITRDRNDIKEFAKEQEGTIILKPLQGSGGQSVFLVRPDDLPNLNQMIDAVSRDGYVIAQEYLRDAEKGDLRLFLMNGVPFQVDGSYAALRRVHSGGDLRSNITAGGKIAKATVTDEALHIAEVIRPKLVMDGMFLVGLDIVGDKLMELNVFSPGGLGSAQELEKVDFCEPVIAALERKVAYAKNYRRSTDNAVIAMI